MLQHALQHLGTAAGLVDRQGQWLYISDAMQKAFLDRSPVMPGATTATVADARNTLRFLTDKAVNCIRRGQTDVHWLGGLDLSVQPLPHAEDGVHTEQVANLIRLAPLESPTQTLCLLTLHGDPMSGSDARAAREMIRSLREQALTDPLTGLYNRRWVMEEAGTLLAGLEENARDIAVVLLDLDHFKKINDTLGHLAGDQVLQIVGARLSGLVRLTDRICRYGGEEFLIVLPDTDPEAALTISERMRKQIAQTMDCLGGLVLSASVGISRVRPGETRLDGAMRRADQALYAAKAAGRNCVRSLY